MRQLLRRLWGLYRRLHLLAARRKPDGPFVPHWRASWTDDVAANRVLSLAARPLRLWAAVRRHRSRFSVVIVNWNSRAFLADTLRAVRRFSPPGTEILVVDNGSRDGSRRFLRRQRDVRRILLPWNLGHAPALDLGFLLARGEYVASLDVDALPLSSGWLDQLATPLERGEATVSGVAAFRGYIHPCCLLMQRTHFLQKRHTFVGRFEKGPGLGSEFWDTGESISIREGRENLAPVERTHVRGPYALGVTFGSVVFHNGCSTRGPDPSMPDLTTETVLESWREAVQRTLAPAPAPGSEGLT